ncbi:MAG: indole-3-glycerol phosphate synthase TrpC [Deltaproteobacteria bacterium HGW-Deltaproteobacteria-12]|jgi:indole-3-glycerol phosphate synthase|nr:MAG: indole-3-glycerol phosphate synthase TrpC [Deltaproteobacteria bacterium HGW-Deltaproteobacteria-12]
MILDRIVKTKKEEVAQLKKDMPLAELQAAAYGLGPCRNFRTAISGKSCAIIAEVKGASPSRGRIVDNFDPLLIATEYEKNGAAAISVLTDEKYFSGHKEFLTKIRSEVMLPLLRKDFIIDPYQIYESRIIGADAVLLIVRIAGERLGEFITLSRELGLAALTEVHTAAELQIALAAGADIIGINNRNLDTFITDIGTCKKLAHLVPDGKIIVAESAITCRADIENIMQAGISTFLIGEALVTAGDIGKKLRELRGD